MVRALERRVNHPGGGGELAVECLVSSRRIAVLAFHPGEGLGFQIRVVERRGPDDLDAVAQWLAGRSSGLCWRSRASSKSLPVSADPNPSSRRDAVQPRARSLAELREKQPKR